MITIRDYNLRANGNHPEYEYVDYRGFRFEYRNGHLNTENVPKELLKKGYELVPILGL